MFTRNLLEETLGILRRNGKTPADVHWVGCEHFWFTWENSLETLTIIVIMVQRKWLKI